VQGYFFPMLTFCSRLERLPNRKANPAWFFLIRSEIHPQMVPPELARPLQTKWRQKSPARNG
jgi:hypothetical protein